MKRKDRIRIVRDLWQTRRDMRLEEIARVCQVSLRTTYRDVHTLIEQGGQHHHTTAIAQ
ncbi:MAG TPA: hypothetical protein VGB22_06840 [candidate division Zixibacteria bacterium]|jgi:DeoR/GlpR family transcriptional regulator of sugar metabolism